VTIRHNFFKIVIRNRSKAREVVVIRVARLAPSHHLVLLNSNGTSTTFEKPYLLKEGIAIMAKVTIYSLDYCPYCVQAKKLLSQRGVVFEEILVDASDRDTRELLRQRSGMKTFPQIFHGEELIGGFSDLKARDEERGLADLCS
jgi:glutaredoxin 3